MEAGLEVALPSAVAARFMGSSEGFGNGGNSGGVVVGEVRWHTEVACSSGGRKDDIHAINVSSPSFWRKLPDSECRMDISQLSSLHGDDALNAGNLRNVNTPPPTLDIDVKLLVQKSSKIERNSSGCSRRSRMLHIESSKSKLVLRDVSGISPELVTSSSAGCNASEKKQSMKQKNCSTSRRGDKVNSRVKHKNRCNSFSLKNGLVGFNSAAGGNNFFGMYGLKPDVFDITKYVDELSLPELLHGRYTSPCIAKYKGKKAASSNNDLLQSVRNACSILQARNILQVQNSAEVDNSYTGRVSTGLVTASAVGQTDGVEGDCCDAAVPTSCEVQESDYKIKTSSIADSPLYTPKDILERLALPPPKDVDLLLSDVSKTIASSKHSTDLRLGKTVPQRTGLPPFSWSHSFAGHTKLGSDAVKLPTSRTTCQGRWIKVESPLALQNGSADLLVDFESLAFDENLVPSMNLMSQHRENKLAPFEQVLSDTCVCSTSMVADEYSPAYTAAQTLLDLAKYSKENPSAVVRILEKPSQMTMKANKLKAIKRSDLFDAPKSTVRPMELIKVGDYRFSSKKIRLSTDVGNVYITQTKPVRKGKSHQSVLVSVKSPPRKLFGDSNASTASYGINIVNKSCTMRKHRDEDRPSSTKQKLWKPSH